MAPQEHIPACPRQDAGAAVRKQDRSLRDWEDCTLAFKLSALGDEAAGPMADQCAALSALGLRHIEVRASGGRSLIDSDPEVAEEAARAITAAGLRVSAYASPLGKVKIDSDLAEHRRRFARALEVAARLGTDGIRIFTFYMPPGSWPQHRDTDRCRMVVPRLQDPILGVAWTLRHEVLFYLLFGMLLLNRTAGRLVLALWAALISWNIAFFWVTGAPWFQGLAGYLPFRIFNIEFFFGMGVALLVSRGPAWRPRSLLVLGTLLFFTNGMIVSFGPVVPIEWPPRQLTYALAAAMILYGLVGSERAGTLKVPASLFAVGTASYSIYLTHLIAIMILQQVLLRIRPFVPLTLDVSFVAIAAIAIAGGVVFSRLVEQPLLRLLRRRPPAIPVPA